MKVFAGMVFTLAILAAESAAAAPWRGHGGGGMNVQAQRERPGGYERGGRSDRGYERQPQRMPPREFAPQRDYRQDYRQERGPDRRDGRLTEDERRDLHRDLDRANREIYNRRR